MGEIMRDPDLINLAWAKDRIDEHIGAVMQICDALRAGKLADAGMDLVQLKHYLISNSDVLRALIQGRDNGV